MCNNNKRLTLLISIIMMIVLTIPSISFASSLDTGAVASVNAETAGNIDTGAVASVNTGSSSKNADGNANGSGNGSGNGKNKAIALTLEKASIADGETGVPLNPTIQLDFNKNICNITVLPNNKMCFHLTEAEINEDLSSNDAKPEDTDKKSSGSETSAKAIPIKLIFPDTQLQQDYKRQVFIIPKENLKPETSYRVSIDNTLTAKNGTTIDNAHTFTFTTGAAVSSEENAILNELGDLNIATYETAYNETSDSVPVNVSGLDDSSDDKVISTALIAKIAGIALIILIIIFSLIFIRGKSHTS